MLNKTKSELPFIIKISILFVILLSSKINKSVSELPLKTDLFIKSRDLLIKKQEIKVDLKAMKQDFK